MTILQLIQGRERDLGGFVARRVLPFEHRQMVYLFAGALAHRDSLGSVREMVALPDGCEDVEPEFVHDPASSLPRSASFGMELSLIAGTAWGLESPVRTLWPTLYADLQLRGGASVSLPDGYAERAAYVVSGALSVGDVTIGTGQMAVFDSTMGSLTAVTDSRAMLLGGAPFPTPRYLWWNFVASSQARIEAARARWSARGFPQVPGETEFTPLPAQ